jgi:putative endonuclease
MNDWVVYICACRDGSLYTGITKNLKLRIYMHNSGGGAKYTAGRRPVKLLLSSEPTDHITAVRLEHFIKGLPKKHKLVHLRLYNETNEKGILGASNDSG